MTLSECIIRLVSFEDCLSEASSAERDAYMRIMHEVSVTRAVRHILYTLAGHIVINHVSLSEFDSHAVKSVKYLLHGCTHLIISKGMIRCTEGDAVGY